MNSYTFSLLTISTVSSSSTVSSIGSITTATYFVISNICTS